MPRQTREEMLAEALALRAKLLEADPDGYPEVCAPREPLRPVSKQNCIVCVHSRREPAGAPPEVLVEWSAPPHPAPRLTWIPLAEARRLAPPEVAIFEDRERGGRQASARDRVYRGATAAGAPPVHPEGLAEAEAEAEEGEGGEGDGDLGDDLRRVEGKNGTFTFRNVIADAGEDGKEGLRGGAEWVLVMPDVKAERDVRSDGRS